MLAQQEDKAFHCLTVEEWAKITSILTYSETKVLYYLLSQNPMGDRSIDCRVRTIAEVMNISIGSVSNALKQLEAKGLIESMQIIRAEITIKPLLMSKNASDYLAKQGGKAVQSTEQQVQPTEHSHQPTEEQVQPTKHEHIYRSRARSKTLKTNSDLNTQERVQERHFAEESFPRKDASKNEIRIEESSQEGNNTESLVETPRFEVATKESQIVSEGQGSAPADLTTKKSSTPRTLALNNRRINPIKGCDKSCSSDPWMVSEYEPNPYLVQWLVNQRTSEQKNLGDRYSSYKPDRPKIKQEIRNDAAHAADLWAEFLEAMHHRVQVFNSRVQSGAAIKEEEVAEITAVSPYAGLEPLPLPSPQSVLAPSSTNTFVIERQKAVCSIAVPEKAINPSAYKEFVAAPLPSEEESFEGRKLFSQRLKELTKDLPSMPKAKFMDTPTSTFDKYRAWLHSGDTPLRTEAIAWVKRKADELDVEYDEYGNIIDFEEVQF